MNWKWSREALVIPWRAVPRADQLFVQYVMAAEYATSVAANTDQTRQNLSMAVGKIFREAGTTDI